MTLRLCDTQWPNSGLFLQNALVEYIGVYSDTNKRYTAQNEAYRHYIYFTGSWSGRGRQPSHTGETHWPEQCKSYTITLNSVYFS